MASLLILEHSTQVCLFWKDLGSAASSAWLTPPPASLPEASCTPSCGWTSASSGRLFHSRSPGTRKKRQLTYSLRDKKDHKQTFIFCNLYSFFLRCNIIYTFPTKKNKSHSPSYRQSISSRLPSPHRKCKTLRPWSRPDLWWPESARTELWGRFPAMMKDSDSLTAIHRQRQNSANNNRLFFFSPLLSSGLTISTGAMLRTSCCSRVMSQ